MTSTYIPHAQDYSALSKREVGRLGEELARHYLESQEMRVLERNFRTRHGEIDIIALDGHTLVFAEVKTRRTYLRGTGTEAITPRKQRTLRTMVGQYLSEHSPRHKDVRIDAVDILLIPGVQPHIRHITAIC